MKAMILAAGLGTRLQPLTNDRPKALVKVGGRTLLEIALARLRHFDVREVIVNVHHHAEMIVDYLKQNLNFGMRVEISREEILLDTGGGLKQAAGFFLENAGDADRPFLLHNVDVLSNIDLHHMLVFHREKQALATVAVQERETSRRLLFDEQNQLCGRKMGDNQAEIVRPAQQMRVLAFCGVHVISPRLLTVMSESGTFSIIPAYLRLAGQGEKILGFRADEYYWRDLGSPESLVQAAHDIEQQRVEL